MVNLEDVEIQKIEKGTRFSASTRWLGMAAGGKAIGCGWHEVPPGHTAWPYHYHSANEEAAYILEGEGTLRIGDATVPIKAGDYIAFPVGPAHAHQITNTGAGPLRYLALSTGVPVEVVGYPDSGKIGLGARFPDGNRMRHLFRLETQVDYYDGEKID